MVSQGIGFTNNEKIKPTYYREGEELILKQIPGTFKVTIFNHTIRRSPRSDARGPGYLTVLLLEWNDND
jgi:hypothetical protein